MTEPVTKSLKGTQTEKNLVAAYMSECQASMRYTFYAAQAYKESYFPIQQAFTETADNEAHHAKVFFKYLTGGEVTVDLPVDAGIIGTTEENLVISVKEEQDEGVVQYTAAAKTAEEEGFPEIAERFRSIAAVEKRHEARFQKYLEQVRTNTVWKRDTPIKWVCLVCGYVYEGCEPPQRCPGCHHPMQHFMATDMML